MVNGLNYKYGIQQARNVSELSQQVCVWCLQILSVFKFAVFSINAHLSLEPRVAYVLYTLLQPITEEPWGFCSFMMLLMNHISTVNSLIALPLAFRF
jgi:hypothetical protein